MSTNNPPTALILGATSSIGRPLIQELINNLGSENLHIRAAVRDEQAAKSFQEAGVETVHFDLDRYETYAPALEGIGRLFLLTGYTVDMLAQSKAIVDAAVKANVQHIVHIGAYATEDTTVAHLGWHQYIECYIERSGIAYTHLRPNYFMQNILRFSNADEPGVIRQFFGNARMSWIDADDIATMAATVLRSPQNNACKIIPLAVDARTGTEIAEVLTQVVGKPFRYEARSPQELADKLQQVGMEPAYARCAVDVNRRLTEGRLVEAADTFDNFEAITGRKPTTWEDFAAKHRDEFLY